MTSASSDEWSDDATSQGDDIPMPLLRYGENDNRARVFDKREKDTPSCPAKPWDNAGIFRDENAAMSSREHLRSHSFTATTYQETEMDMCPFKDDSNVCQRQRKQERAGGDSLPPDPLN